jgi:histidyl-tRNA synthetase
MGEAAQIKALSLCEALRSEGFCALTDVNGRGLKAQMKYANKIGARYTLVLGDDEIQKGTANVKNMENGQQTPVSMNDFTKDFYAITMEDAFSAMEDSVDKMGQ